MAEQEQHAGPTLDPATSIDTATDASLTAAASDPAQDTPGIVIDLSNVVIDATHDILVRVRLAPDVERLMVIPPIAVLYDEGLAYMPDVLHCKGRLPYGLNVPACGDLGIHDAHIGLSQT